MSGRRKKPKTQYELFLHILNKWLDNEYCCISEWGISNKEKLRANVKKEYEEYIKLWEQLKEQNTFKPISKIVNCSICDNAIFSDMKYCDRCGAEQLKQQK